LQTDIYLPGVPFFVGSGVAAVVLGVVAVTMYELIKGKQKGYIVQTKIIIRR
jgi:hypothetical protein